MNNRLYTLLFTCLLTSSLHAFNAGRTKINNLFCASAQTEAILNVLEDNFFYQLKTDAGYGHSFNAKSIAKHFFGQQCFTISGSDVQDRKETDILANLLGLPSDFKSDISFKPTIKNLFLDTSLALDFSWLARDLVLFVRAPLVHTRWNLGLSEKVQAPGVNDYPAGYFSGGNKPLVRDKLPVDVKAVFKGNTTFGDMQEPLRYGKIDGTQKKTGIADITLELRSLVCNKEKIKWGFLAQCVIPTGNKVTSEYLFEPMVGDNHHWKAGLGVHGLVHAWQHEDEQRSFDIFAQTTIAHLFASQQKRSFDLKNNGHGSRYMLLARFVDLYDDVLQIPLGTTPTKQYSGDLVPAINQTTLDCKIKINTQIDALIGCVYQSNDWQLQAGYNLKYKSVEKITKRERFVQDTYAIKGTSQVYGFFDTGVLGADQVDIAVPLTASNSKATLRTAAADFNSNYRNQLIDNVEGAAQRFDDGVLNNLTTNDSNAMNITQNQIYSSKPPIFVSDADLDSCSALVPRAIASSLFVQIQKQFEHDEWNGFCDAGLRVAVGHSKATISEVVGWVGLGFAY